MRARNSSIYQVIDIHHDYTIANKIELGPFNAFLTSERKWIFFQKVLSL